MRVRTSTGVRPVEFFGSFYMANTTDTELAAINSDMAVACKFELHTLFSIILSHFNMKLGTASEPLLPSVCICNMYYPILKTISLFSRKFSQKILSMVNGSKASLELYYQTIFSFVKI